MKIEDGTESDDDRPWFMDETFITVVLKPIGNGAGLLVDAGLGWATFLPKSQLRNSDVDLETLVGCELECEVVFVDEERGNLVVREVRTSDDKSSG